LGHLLLSSPSPPFGKNLFYPLVLWFCTRENIRDNKKDRVFASLRWSEPYREIPSIASMHMCIITHIGSSQPDLFTTSWSPSHSGLCQFKTAIFSPLQWVHQVHSSSRFPSLSLSLPCMFSL
jgi:hypothetical protein